MNRSYVTFARVGRPGSPRRALGIMFLGLSAALLSGCSAGGHPDLDAYAQQVKARPGGRIEPVPEIKTYPLEPYGVASLRSPFRPEEQDKIDKPAPKEVRNPEALEQYPLDSLKLVGHVAREGESWAVITAPDQLVYRVQVNNYMGQNQGKIHTITEDRVQLTERVPGPNGGLIEREASLALTE